MGNDCKIKIPDNLTMTSVDGIYRTALKISGPCLLRFDFSDVSSLTPQSLLLLVIASRFFYDNFGCVIEWTAIKLDVLSYMDRMNIGDIDFVKIERPSFFERIRYKKSDALVELSTIHNGREIGNAILETKNVFSSWLPDSGSECRRHLLTLIKETVENSVEHSSTIPSNGFCYYVLEKNVLQNGKTEVQIAVGDTGIGMLASQRRVHPSTKDDAEAIIKALMDGRSGRETGGGGMGYVNIRESLEPLNGEICIRSGRAHVEHIAGAPFARIYRHTFNCAGTQIIFKCRT